MYICNHGNCAKEGGQQIPTHNPQFVFTHLLTHVDQYWECASENCMVAYDHPAVLLEHLKSHDEGQFRCSLNDCEGEILRKDAMIAHFNDSIRAMRQSVTDMMAKDNCEVITLLSSLVPKRGSSTLYTQPLQSTSSIFGPPWQNEFSCVLCDKISEDRTTHIRHIARHIPTTDIPCFCGKEFMNSTQFAQHLHAAHKKKYKFICYICERDLSRKDRLGKHIKSLHSDEHAQNSMERKFSCSKCKTTFSRMQELEGHIPSHDSEPEFKCKCGRLFQREYKYRRHLKTHNNESTEEQFEAASTCRTLLERLEEHPSQSSAAPGMKYTCTFGGCDKPLKSLASSMRHITDSHAEEMEAQCPIEDCSSESKPFASYTLFIEHIQSSHTNQLWECAIRSCSKTFHNPFSLIRHIHSHKEEEGTLQRAAAIANVRSQLQKLRQLITEKLIQDKLGLLEILSDLVPKASSSNATSRHLTGHLQLLPPSTTRPLQPRPDQIELLDTIILSYDEERCANEFSQSTKAAVEAPIDIQATARQVDVAEVSYLCKAPGCREPSQSWDDYWRHSLMCPWKLYLCSYCSQRFLTDYELSEHVRQNSSCGDKRIASQMSISENIIINDQAQNCQSHNTGTQVDSPCENSVTDTWYSTVMIGGG